jgi:hypothetical protein
MTLSLSRRKPPPREILPLTTVLTSPAPLPTEPARKTHRWLLVLILLPVMVTLLFILWQLTPWGDACPEEAPCEVQSLPLVIQDFAATGQAETSR